MLGQFQETLFPLRASSTKIKTLPSTTTTTATPVYHNTSAIYMTKPHVLSPSLKLKPLVSESRAAREQRQRLVTKPVFLLLSSFFPSSRNSPLSAGPMRPWEAETMNCRMGVSGGLVVFTRYCNPTPYFKLRLSFWTSKGGAGKYKG